MVQTLTQPNSTYVLGYSGDELSRLIGQARYFGDLTDQVLRLAGVEEGMRALDIGCGAGDVSFLAARIVGPAGRVLGVDKSAEAIDVAAGRAAGAGLTNVRFQVDDVLDLTLDEPVDAIIGRFVLMYFADPAVVLRRLTSFVKPAGVVAFQEFDGAGAKSEPACPAFETAIARIIQAFTRAGFDIQIGLRLGRIFQEAGLPAPRMILGARIEQGPEAGAYEQVAQITRTLVPVMERTGVARPDEVDVETLAERLRQEAVAADATLVSPSVIGAWTRTGPGADPRA